MRWNLAGSRWSKKRRMNSVADDGQSARAMATEPAARNDAVDVRMMLKLLVPVCCGQEK